LAPDRLPFEDPLDMDQDLHARLGDVVDSLVRMGITLKEASGELEKLYIERVLRRCRGNRTRGARQLGMHRNTLNRKIEQYGLNGDPNAS